MNSLKDLPEGELVQLAKIIAKVFKSFMERVKDIVVRLSRFVQAIRKVKPMTKDRRSKVRHSLVKKITSRKAILLDKRTNMYHCRNNC